eukprot:TRINITY_DN704_c0_g1_i5.p1 TRINITY_DN704_c0_g1~~TRINITY_DN704_c0_g1_i5.p1  ORF type:complete len:1116 (+),score=253.84 TRINITY_DN704_c0_g1_i5:130-3348(+)
MLHRQHTQQRDLQRPSVTGKRFRAYRPRSRVAYVRIALVLVFLLAFLLLKPAFRFFQPQHVVIHGGVPIHDDASVTEEEQTHVHHDDAPPFHVPRSNAAHVHPARHLDVSSLRDRRSKHSMFQDHPHRFEHSVPEQHVHPDVMRHQQTDHSLGGDTQHLESHHDDIQVADHALHGDVAPGTLATQNAPTHGAIADDVGDAHGLHGDSNADNENADDANADDTHEVDAEARHDSAEDANSDDTDDDGTGSGGADANNASVENVNDANADDVKADDASADDANANDVNADDANADDANADDANADDTNADDANADDANAGDSTARYANAGDAISDDANAGDANAGDANTGDANADDVNTDDVNAGEVNADDINADDANAHDANAGDANTGDANVDEVNPGDVKTDDTGADDANADDANTDDAITDDAITAAANADNANADGANATDANADDANVDDDNANADGAYAADANADDANVDDDNANDIKADNTGADGANAEDANADGDDAGDVNADDAKVGDSDLDDAGGNSVSAYDANAVDTSTEDGNVTNAQGSEKVPVNLHAANPSTNGRIADDALATNANTEATNADDLNVDHAKTDVLDAMGARAEDEEKNSRQAESVSREDETATKYKTDDGREDVSQADNARGRNDNIGGEDDDGVDVGAPNSNGEEGDAHTRVMQRDEDHPSREDEPFTEDDDSKKIETLGRAEQTDGKVMDDVEAGDPQDDQNSDIVSPLHASTNMRQSNVVAPKPQQNFVVPQHNIRPEFARQTAAASNVTPQNLQQQYGALQPVHRISPLSNEGPQHQQAGELRPVQRTAAVQNVLPQDMQKQFHENEEQIVQRIGHTSSVPPIQLRHMEPQPRQPSSHQEQPLETAQGLQKGFVVSPFAQETSHAVVGGVQNPRPEVLAPKPGRLPVGSQGQRYEQLSVKRDVRTFNPSQRAVDIEQDDSVIMNHQPVRASISQNEPQVLRQSLQRQHPPLPDPQRSMVVQNNISRLGGSNARHYNGTGDNEQSDSLDTRMSQGLLKRNEDMIFDHMKQVPERSLTPANRSHSSLVTISGRADPRSTVTHAGELKV